MKNKKVSLILNIFLILFEVLSLSYNLVINHKIYLIFYTELSNILALFSSILYIYYLDKKMPTIVGTLKYVSCVCLSITFLVVFFILTPMSNFDFFAMFTQGILLYHHLLCPLICLVSFIFYDDVGLINKNSILYSMLFTGIYGLIMIFLNLIGIVSGPYPFLMVRTQSIISSMIWLVIIFGFSYVISYLIMYYYNRRLR